jgi:hypothetical protein
VKLRPTRTVRSSIVGLAVLAAVADAGPAGATESAATLDCEPMSCAAAYIGVPRSALAADIVNETRRTGTLGTQVAIEQLDAAMARQLSASGPRFDSSLLPWYSAVIARHDAIRDALLDQTVTALRGVGGGVSPP